MAALTEDEARELSRLLWDARELIDMFGDITAAKIGERDPGVDDTRDKIDAFRARYGWDAGGFGSESAVSR